MMFERSSAYCRRSARVCWNATSLDVVSVTVVGKPAYVYFIGPTQLNLLAPADATEGAVPVQVMTTQGRSTVVNAVEACLGGVFPDGRTPPR